jgi:hypothetical protein
MIKLRVDVDYPYSSRVKSLLWVALRIKNRKGKNYLKNARVIAKIINNSSREVKGYWFFTPYTIPDKELLELLNPERHEIALHVANHPVEEWKTLEKEINRKVTYYTIHGTQRIFARLLWGRKLSQAQASIPVDFPLTSFHDYKTISLDRERYRLGCENVTSLAEEWIGQDVVLSFHPEWLLQKNKAGKRGPFYDVLLRILKVYPEVKTLSIQRKIFFNLGHDTYEFEKNITPNPVFMENLRDLNVDVYTFLERKWCCPIPIPSANWKREDDNVALLTITQYDAWWQYIGKKTRNMVRRAEKSGVKVEVVEPTDKLADGIWKIYNETPIRQGRAFTHYGESLELISKHIFEAQNNTFIGAYLNDELVGFIQILYGDNIAIVSNILSLQRHWDKSINNALLAKAVEICAAKGQKWLMYGRIGNHPSLDRFKENNGFVKYPISRFYIPLTGKGRFATWLVLHKDLKDALPDFLKNRLIPVSNWVSRNIVKIKHR